VHQDLIYDVGMNNGEDTAYYLRRGFRVVAIEADTRLAKCAAERFRAQISSGQLRILNIGIAAEEGELPFWICETAQNGVLLIENSRLAMVAHLTRSWCPVVGLLRFLRNLEYFTT
jgi:FkbM family methyltransferase